MDQSNILCYLIGMARQHSIRRMMPPHSKRLGRLLQLPGGRKHKPRSCAVVSNSGVLRAKHHGKRIDSADIVMRFNDAPTAQYEQMIGAPPPRNGSQNAKE
eukprot:1888225-Amphidinium_carterae.1